MSEPKKETTIPELVGLIEKLGNEVSRLITLVEQTVKEQEKQKQEISQLRKEVDDLFVEEEDEGEE